MSTRETFPASKINKGYFVLALVALYRVLTLNYKQLNLKKGQLDDMKELILLFLLCHFKELKKNV